MNKTRKIHYTKEQLEPIVKESYSFAECLRKFDKAFSGGGYKSIKYWITYYNLDTSHFDPMIGRQAALNNGRKVIPNNDLFQINETARGVVRKRIIRDKLLDHTKCSECGITSWNGKSLVMELDHINGVRTDNRLENLRFLCSNCHSQTSTHCGNNNKTEKLSKPLRISDINPNWRHAPKLSRRKVERPSKEQLLQDFSNLPNFTQLSKKYGVSDNSIRKWFKWYQVDLKELKCKIS